MFLEWNCILDFFALKGIPCLKRPLKACAGKKERNACFSLPSRSLESKHRKPALRQRMASGSTGVMNVRSVSKLSVPTVSPESGPAVPDSFRGAVIPLRWDYALRC